MNVLSSSVVITGLVPVIPIREAWRSSHRDGRDRPGHDILGLRQMVRRWLSALAS